MRFTIASVGIFALFNLASSQDLSGLPSCALSCATGAIGSTGCALTDAKCICTATNFLSGVETCVQGACSQADQQATLQFAVKFCAQANVTITLPTAPATSGAPASTAPPMTPATMTSSAGMSSSASQAPSTYTGAANFLTQDWTGVVGAAALGVAALL
ncbi:uncharacterized protein PV06_05893 [Exophiala oligosperma]|uniref:CFEM domain-containing protein n=2 Tax=Chaetothyriales TaxID=34395 RepID=A0A0D2AQT8_9EURO|nr:uncharacterized protein PV06_05893 [Exophiala oligosperma]KAJ9627553.1 hypothetical protein H2204_009592 [Knufia peltigerae]KIW42331.1 hypothetical protein PV06_05893 [Exophiala oligosperma]